MSFINGKSRRQRLFLILFIVFIGRSAIAQVTIKGPVCVTTEVGYQYNITGPWASTTTFQICITGGTLLGSTTACYSGKPVSYIRVNWDSSAKTGQLAITSSAGNGTLNVSIITPLRGGSMDSVSHYQLTDSSKIPKVISCSLPSGGNCAPIYSYQWQQSYDMITWTDIPGANHQNLSFSAPVSQIIYYRRKVVETKSGSFAFSNEATIDSY